MSDKQHCDGQLQSGFHSLTGESERHTSECESATDEFEHHSAAGERHDIDMIISECTLSDEGDLKNTASDDVEEQRATLPLPILDGGAGDVISRSTTDTTFWRRIADFPQRRPFVTNLIVATIKACVADIFVQAVCTCDSPSRHSDGTVLVQEHVRDQGKRNPVPLLLSFQRCFGSLSATAPFPFLVWKWVCLICVIRSTCEMRLHNTYSHVYNVHLHVVTLNTTVGTSAHTHVRMQEHAYTDTDTQTQTQT